jgi:hypothetical protein
VRLEGLGKLEKFIHLIGNRTHDLPVCSVVPQPTTLLRAPAFTVNARNIVWQCVVLISVPYGALDLTMILGIVGVEPCLHFVEGVRWCPKDVVLF